MWLPPGCAQSDPQASRGDAYILYHYMQYFMTPRDTDSEFGGGWLRRVLVAVRGVGGY